MRFDWDEEKNRANTAKHGVSFELASLVFEDPFVKTVSDPFEEEARWRTFGMVDGLAIVLVIHTWTEEEIQGREEGEEEREDVVRIISARRATRQERRSYEESLRED